MPFGQEVQQRASHLGIGGMWRGSVGGRLGGPEVPRRVAGGEEAEGHKAAVGGREVCGRDPEELGGQRPQLVGGLRARHHRR